MIRSCLFATAMLTVLAAPAVSQPPTVPNIVVIVADDLGYADLGFQGCRDIPTPHLDVLAQRALVCTDGYVSHPFCSPTRAGLMTGRYQQRFGHENNPTWLPQDPSVGLPLDQTTIAAVLRKAGYATGAIGKWHLGAHPSFHPNRRGFDWYFGLLGGGHQYFDHNQFWTNPARAKQEYFIPLVRNETPVEEAEYLTDALGREAVAFVDAHRQQPFFLYLAFNAPHTPLQAPEKYLQRVKDIADEKRRTYGAMICAMDDAIGAVMDKLKERQLDRNTLVFFFSDNGGPVSVTNSRNTPLRGAKGQVYEGGIRVPFLISWPARLKPGRFEAPVIALDVLPTAAAAAATTPDVPAGLDGVNLLPSLLAEAPDALQDRTLFWRTGGGDSFAVRRGTIKLVQVGNRPAELYDLSTDIAEARDLAGSRPDLVAERRKALDAWNATLVAPRWQNPAQAKTTATPKNP
jgi:arylsulfatase A-like enzyme